ncbi:MAG: hypothetical protein EBZ78_11490, partial [Verrucomicrobia bacterium]|nr:hypothetical protein [Verrucomicrobiota bacterium]
VTGLLDDDGVPHVEMRLRMTQAEADALLASYDPTSATSPPAPACLPVVRPIADALLGDTP